MTAVDDIVSRIPLADLAARLGVDEGTAEQATRQALPALLSGIQANAADPGGAASFAEAVGQHDNDLAEGGVDLNGVDEGDGDRIVGHVFGEQRGQVVQQLGGLGGLGGGTGGGGDLMSRLLPLLAPIVMSYLAKRLGGGAAAGAAGQQGGLGDLLGSVLGGGLGGALGGGLGGTPGGPQGPQQGGLPGGLGDLLGGLLGGGRRA